MRVSLDFSAFHRMCVVVWQRYATLLLQSSPHGGMAATMSYGECRTPVARPQFMWMSAAEQLFRGRKTTGCSCDEKSM